LLSSAAIGTRAVAVGAGGLRRSICILVAATGFDSLDVFRRLDLITPYHRAGIYCGGAVDVPCVLHLKQFGNLTRVHASIKALRFLEKNTFWEKVCKKFAKTLFELKGTF
jgi:hypothetical protein